MRRFSLGCVLLVAAMTALPASGREFRTDLIDCTDPDYALCWDGGPSGAVPVLPVGVTDGGYSTDPSAATGLRFTTSNFAFTFDYQQFLQFLSNNFPTLTPNDPQEEITHGLTRPASDVPGPWIGDESPLLRINWLFDPSLYPDLANIFEAPVEINNVSYFGVQLIFSDEGFEVNGLKKDGYAFASSTLDGEPLWGPDQACDTFDRSGQCIGSSVPEPSSYALLGMGLLALSFGLRTGKPARARSA